MNIAFVVESPLPAALYGGTERVVWGLMQVLARWGHRLWLVAPEGTRCPFATVIIRNPRQRLEEQLPEAVELTHFHVPVPEGFSRPHLLTVHGNSLPSNISEQTVFVSRNHAERFGVDSFVHNGLMWQDYPQPELKLPRKRYHFLGKAAWRVKNLQGAIDTTLAIPGAHLDVLGGYRLNFRMGFRFTLSPRVHFHGMVDDETKAELIQRSRGLIFPVRWHEPFGLAIIESLYYGAPVYGTPYGSLPELVTPEVGYLDLSAQALAEHIAVASYAPQRCQDYARELFSAERMATDYLARYEQVLSGAKLCHRLPQPLNIERNLPWS